MIIHFFASFCFFAIAPHESSELAMTQRAQVHPLMHVCIKRLVRPGLLLFVLEPVQAKELECRNPHCCELPSVSEGKKSTTGLLRHDSNAF